MMWIQTVWFVLLIYQGLNANKQEIWEIIEKEKMEIDKKM